MKSTSRSREVRQDRRPGRPASRCTGPDVARTGTPSSLRDHVGQRRLAEAGRAVQQHVIERLAALLRGGDRHLQVLADAVLADVLVERARAQPRFVLRVLVDARGGDEAVVRHCGRHFASSRSACFSVRSKPPSRRRLAAPRRRPFRRAADDTPGSSSAESTSSRSAGAPARRRAAGRRRRVRARQPILQLEHDALGRLLADAGNRRQPREVAALDRARRARAARCPTAPPAPASGRCR